MSWELNLPIAIEQALQNCLAHGDTDIFPEPHIFQEWRKFPKQAIDATLSLHEFISSENDRAKFECIRSFVPSGPTGFRLGTQIEPIGNLYFLALTLLCAPNLELNRQTIQSRRVHSYRYQPIDAECRIFQPEFGWRSFQLQAKFNAEQFSHVVVCDIADFYRQIKPISIANALANSDCPVSLQMRLLQVLDLLDLSVSGLPIGGPASRILAEAVLRDVDANFATENMTYCRFVDDIRIFSDSQQVAFEHLLLVNEILYEKGFNLQKSKTRVLNTKEWLGESSFHAVFTPTKGNLENIEDLRKLLMLPSLDPYSEMRAQNDLRLEEFARKPHALEFLKRELNKSRLHSVMANHLLSSLQFMPALECEEAFAWLLDSRRSNKLAPLMTKILHIISKNFSKLPNPDVIQNAIEKLLFGNHYVSKISLHAAMMLRILQLTKQPINEETHKFLKLKIQESSDTLFKVEIIILLGKWNCINELLEIESLQNVKSKFERQALEIAMAPHAF